MIVKLWRVDFESTVVNDFDEDKYIAVESDIVDADGTVVATAKAKGKAELRDKTTLKYFTEVNNPKIWDTETPNLYRVVTRVYVDGVISDEDYTRIGFRTIAIDADKGFILNGRKVLIKGVCMHQDFGLTGLVLPDNVAKYKLDLIKQMGANGVRLCHYMHCERTMDLLDEMGMIVFDETRWFESTEESLEQLRGLVMHFEYFCHVCNFIKRVEIVFCHAVKIRRYVIGTNACCHDSLLECIYDGGGNTIAFFLQRLNGFNALFVCGDFYIHVFINAFNNRFRFFQHFFAGFSRNLNVQLLVSDYFTDLDQRGEKITLLAGENGRI